MRNSISCTDAGEEVCVCRHIFELRALTLELDECLSRLAIVKPTYIAHLFPVHIAECVAAREGLRIRHFHLFAALPPRRRNPATLSRSPNSRSIISGDRGEGLRLCATVDPWCLELWRLRCPRVIAAGGWWRRQRHRVRARNRSVGVESRRSVQGTSNGAVHRDARWGGWRAVLGNGVLHRQRCLQGSSVARVQDRGWGYPSWVIGVRWPLSRRHREVVRGRGTVGGGGGMQVMQPLLGRERQRIE
jgi:hypothetical protein